MLRIPILSCLTISRCGRALVIAQGPVGTMTGTVTDPAGASVPGATVIAINAATGVETKTTTTNTGTYTLPIFLPAPTRFVSLLPDFGRRMQRMPYYALLRPRSSTLSSRLAVSPNR